MNLNYFLEELRRRKVFRTAAAYLAGVFIILQVADLTFAALGFPPAAYRTLVIIAGVGFPLVILLSWFLDLHRGRAVSEASPAGDVASPRHARITTVAVFAILLLSSGALGWFAVGRFRSVDEDLRRVIAVLPFDVIGDPQLAYLENGIVEMVSRNIDGAANLRTVGPEMVISVAKKRYNGTAATAGEIAKQLAARYLVSGNIARAGTRLRVTVSVQDFARSGSRPVTQVVDGSPDDLFGVVDRVSAQVLAATRSGEDAQLSASAAQTTRSLPALRSYLEGEDFYRVAKYDSAVAHFSEAVALDSAFALAYYRLALAHLSHGTAPAARKPADNAVRHSTGLPARDRALIGTLADAINGHWRQSIESMRTLMQRYPNDLELTYNLATMLMLYNPRHGKSRAEAGPLLDRVVAADPEFLCPI